VLRNGAFQAPPAGLEEISDLIKEAGTLVWLDVVDPTAEDLAVVEREFDLSPLAVEDAATPHERPKIDAYPHYWFVVVQGTTSDEAGITIHEMAVFAGVRFVLTIRHSPAYPIKEIEERLLAHPEKCCQGAGFLLYTILDTVVDGYLPVGERFLERVEDIEDVLFQAGSQMHKEILPEIFRRKREAQQFRRAVVPMRDILNQIIREDVDLFPQEEMPYFRDVYDHVIRVIDELDSARDLVSSALEIHLSVTANRQNEVAKQLTIMATIFLPLSYMTGFFGQNFSFLVTHIGGEATFFWLGVGTEVVAIIALILFFKLRGWF
jgi:magnesium transporter